MRETKSERNEEADRYSETCRVRKTNGGHRDTKREKYLKKQTNKKETCRKTEGERRGGDRETGRQRVRHTESKGQTEEETERQSSRFR